MSATRTLLRGARVLLGDDLSFDRQPRDVLVEAGRIAAIEPAGHIPSADQLIELPQRLPASMARWSTPCCRPTTTAACVPCSASR